MPGGGQKGVAIRQMGPTNYNRLLGGKRSTEMEGVERVGVVGGGPRRLSFIFVDWCQLSWLLP